MSRPRRRLAPAVERKIARYWPRELDADPAEVEAVMERVRLRVAAAKPATPKVARTLLWAATRHALWGRQFGIDDDEVLYQRRSVEAHLVAARRDRQPGSWRYEMRAGLRQLGATANPAEWPPPPPRIGRSAPPRPYGPHDERGFAADALLDGYPQRAARLFITGAVLGMGMSGPAIRAARVEDLVELRGGRVGMRVEGRAAPVVPARAAYTNILREAAGEAATGNFVTADGANSVYSVAAGITSVGLSLPRARATWLTAHLVAGTPLPALQAVAGPLSLNTLAALLPAAGSALSPEQAVEEALGA